MVKSRRLRFTGSSLSGVTRNTYRIFVRINTGKGPLERPGRVWENNFKMGIKK
jgi:hypothetical protein